jgi:2-desacetyl-2-hydroxyethyl bacteriochlorophyllide A dehydrogenase
MNIPASMQALQMQGPGELALTTLPTPVPGPREVLIRTVAATICTSDLHDLAGNPSNIALPRVLGHEPEGVVVACGQNARDFATGTRVAVHPVVPCGDCSECARGFGHLCGVMGHLGCDRDGAFAEYFVQRADRVRRLTHSVPPGAGALLEPIAVCLQAIARAGNIQNRDVLVAGDGPFGNIIARLAARAGARRLIVAGREPFRLSRIPGVETITGNAPPASVDAAILAVNSAEAAAACVAALRPRGRLVIFSALHQPLALDWNAVHLRELEIVGSCNDEDRLDAAMECLGDPSLAIHEIITHRIPFANWPDAFILARDGHDQALKIALTFPEAA